MSEKQWVQHISGQGEKWLVVYGGDPIDWMVLCKATDGERNRALPKSEYRLCPAPEVWRDVTEQVTTVFSTFQNTGFWNVALSIPTVGKLDTFRLRKVQLWKQYEGRGEYKDQWAFIVEQEVTQ